MADDTGQSYIQVPPDGSGKRSRTVERNQIAADGTVQPVQTQVVATQDDRGRSIDFAAMIDLLTEIRDLLKEIRLSQELHEGLL